MSMIYEHQLNISKAFCIHCLGVSHNRKFSIVAKSAYCCFIILYKLFFAVIIKNTRIILFKIINSRVIYKQPIIFIFKTMGNINIAQIAILPIDPKR